MLPNIMNSIGVSLSISLPLSLCLSLALSLSLSLSLSPSRSPLTLPVSLSAAENGAQVRFRVWPGHACDRGTVGWEIVLRQQLLQKQANPLTGMLVAMHYTTTLHYFAPSCTTTLHHYYLAPPPGLPYPCQLRQDKIVSSSCRPPLYYLLQ